MATKVRTKRRASGGGLVHLRNDGGSKNWIEYACGMQFRRGSPRPPYANWDDEVTCPKCRAWMEAHKNVPTD